MPGITDWQSNPLSTVQNLFAEDNDLNTMTNRVSKTFGQRLENPDSLLWIPSLNDVPLHDLKTNVLVRFRCMIQDMFDPEFYIGAYEIIDKTSGQKEIKCGMYRDIAECSTHQHIDMNAATTVPMDRQTLYCVPLPGENQWVKDIYADQSKCKQSTTCHNSRPKRRLDEDQLTMSSGCGLDLSTKASPAVPMEDESAAGDANDEKKAKKDEEKGDEMKGITGHIQDLNFPLADETGPACLVKIYDNFEGFKVNDGIEFVGILSVDPALSDNNSGEISSFGGEDSMVTEEQRVHSPPPSLVPRLHVLIANKLAHSNPLLPSNLAATSVLETMKAHSEVVRSNLCSMFADVLGGDELAGEYLLLHLLSNVYARREMLSLGKFALNISGCRTSSCLPIKINTLLQTIVTKSHFLPMTLKNMNTLRFTPKKNYSEHRLKSGMLQLTEKTHVIIDETVLEPGQLDQKGIENLKALGNAITWQKLQYDFNFHTADFPTNLVLLILSEAKSMLPSDCHIKLEYSHTDEQLSVGFDNVMSKLNDSVLTKIRSYLGLMRELDYNLPEPIQKEIEEEFVELRKQNPENMTVDDFHCLLLVARLLSLSYGKTTLTKDLWQRAQVLESARKNRLTVH
ncbi:mini-chromosome maintenance complex-binding protein-like [Antedon mediterranea]|uniref:mini-chromosome maintenance complex-binding protein-like n=1 Tax=Antedon mediterranea TaxID=105859 RepID=UPI003AF7CCEA